MIEAVAVKSAEHVHLTHAESNEFTSTRNQEECVEIRVISQGEETSTKDMKDCPECPVNIVNSVPPLSNDDNLKPCTLVEELVVYTEEMALFHRHEITSPRYSFNVPTQDRPVKDDDHHDSDDVFINEGRLSGLYNTVEEQLFKDCEGVGPCESDVHISQGLLVSYDFNSVPLAPWGCTEEPQNYNPGMFAIPKLSDLYDTEGEGILGVVVMKEDRGNEVEVDAHRYTSYDPGYGTPLRMMDYYDTVDSPPAQDGGGGNEEEEDVPQDLGVSADDNGDGINGDQIHHDDCDQVLYHGDDGGDDGIYHETTIGDSGYQVKYYVGDGDHSAENFDSVFVIDGVTVKSCNDEIAGRQRRLSSYDNTVTPDDRMLMESDHMYPLENISLKVILEKAEEANSAEEGRAIQEPKFLPLSNKLPTDGNGSQNALTPDFLMTTTSSGDTSPALRECTIGVRVASRDSLAGVGPDWEESRSSSDDAGDQLEKLAISNISSAYGQVPVIKESEGIVKTNVSLVSKLKKELREGLILPSLQPALIREKYDKGQEAMKDGQQMLAQQEMEKEGQQQQQHVTQEQLQDNQQQQQQRQQQQQQRHDEKTNKENENGHLQEAAAIASLTVTEAQVGQDLASVDVESRQEIIIIENADLTHLEIARGEFKLELKQKNVTNENILFNKQAFNEEMSDQLADNRQLFILEHKECDGQGIEDDTWLDHGQNEIINTSINDNESKVPEEINQVSERCSSSRGEIDEQSKQNEIVDNLELGKYMSNDIHEAALDVHEGILDVHEGTLDVHEGTLDVHEGTLDIQKGTLDIQEGTLDVPDIVVTQDKEKSFEEHEDQIKDTEIVAAVDVGNLQGLDSSNSDDKLNVFSKDKSLNSSDTSKSFPESSLKEDVNSTGNSEKPRGDDSSVGNIEKHNKEIFHKTRRSPRHDNDFSMKRRASFSESVVRELQDDRGQGEVNVEGKDLGGEVNQPKPPPEGTSKGCVNAR